MNTRPHDERRRHRKPLSQRVNRACFLVLLNVRAHFKPFPGTDPRFPVIRAHFKPFPGTDSQVEGPLPLKPARCPSNRTNMGCLATGRPVSSKWYSLLARAHDYLYETSFLSHALRECHRLRTLALKNGRKHIESFLRKYFGRRAILH